jgi:L-fuconolactonase
MSPLSPWADLPKLLALAGHDNVVVKIGASATLSKEPTTQ